MSKKYKKQNKRKGEEMRITISTDNGFVSAYFERCPLYTIVDIKERKEKSHKKFPTPVTCPTFYPVFWPKKESM